MRRWYERVGERGGMRGWYERVGERVCVSGCVRGSVREDV